MAWARCRAGAAEPRLAADSVAAAAGIREAGEGIRDPPRTSHSCIVPSCSPAAMSRPSAEYAQLVTETRPGLASCGEKGRRRARGGLLAVWHTGG